MNSETKVIGIIAIITIVIIAVGLTLAGNGSAAKKPAVAISPELLVRENSPRQTGSNPQIQIVEFADFECPACAAFHTSLKRVKQEYGDKIDFVLRIIPLHKNSLASAGAAFAAGEQGKFFEMHDILFEKQPEWTAYNADVKTLFETYAGSIGLDVEKFKSDIATKSKDYSAIVERDSDDASAMNITATPSLVINGKTVVQGGMTYENLKKLIDTELAEVKPL